MKQKINIAFSVIVCCVILAFFLVMGCQEKVTEASDEPAAEYEQLELCIGRFSNMETVNIWKSEADCYYFFLPSCAVNSRIFFWNLQEGDSIVIGENTYEYNDNIAGELEFNITYDMQMSINGEWLPIQQVVFMCSKNIPAVFIDTETGSMDAVHSDKAIKEAAELTVINQRGKVEFSEEIEYIKARGNSTFTEVEKKSYQMKLWDKSSLLGMDEAKKWILLANAKDGSLIRNALIFDFTDQYTGVESIEGVFVDVYLNGDYAGNYYLCEKVEVGKNRLDIIDLADKNEMLNGQSEMKAGDQYVSCDGTVRAVAGLENPEDITGGYLLERIVEGEYALARSAFVSSKGYYYCVVSPENATVEQVEYICGVINELEKAISQPNGVNPETGKHFSEYMDVDSWVSKYLIEEVFNNPDAPAASTYLYKNSDTVDSRLYFGPVWDYDRAIGGYAVNIYEIDDPKQIGYRGLYASELLKFEEIGEAVKTEYKETFLPFIEEEAAKRINILQESVQISAQMDYVRWPQSVGYYEGWEANGEYLKSFLEERVKYLSGVWLEEAKYHTVTFLDYYGQVYRKYRIKHGEYLTEIPVIAAYVAVFNGWKNTATGKGLDSRLPVLEDVEYESAWIDANLVLLNGLAMAGIDIEDIDIAALEALLEAAKAMQEGDDE